MSTTTHAGKCQFCGFSLNLEIDDDCPITDAAKWIRIAACNRCADHRAKLSRYVDTIDFVLGRLHDARASRGEETQRAAEASARESLDKTGKALMRAICDHWRVTFHYDSAFVDECLSHPGKTRFMVSFLNNSVRRSREARQVKEVVD